MSWERGDVLARIDVPATGKIAKAISAQKTGAVLAVDTTERPVLEADRLTAVPAHPKRMGLKRLGTQRHVDLGRPAEDAKPPR
jgi:hypothetical protein